MRHLFRIVILVITVSACSKEQPKNEKIQKIVEEYAVKKLFNGSLIVAHKDSVIFLGSFGYASLETKDTITSSTLFPIASLTKQFTAAAIMMLQEKGKLSIEDKIGDYIDVPPFMQLVTIKSLMNHTSGIVLS
jgi:CubicO group peptidase (beta-lactamase class C family)